MLIEIIVAVVIGYLIGSIPFAFIFGRLWGKNVGKMGDNNIGATNVLKNVSKIAGILTGIFDILKGLVPLLIAFFIFNLPEFGLGLMGLSLVVGHIFPIYLKFKGGKGIATAFGVFAFFLIWYIAIPVVLFLLLMFVFKKKTWYFVLWTVPILGIFTKNSFLTIMFLFVIVDVLYLVWIERKIEND